MYEYMLSYFAYAYKLNAQAIKAIKQWERWEYCKIKNEKESEVDTNGDGERQRRKEKETKTAVSNNPSQDKGHNTFAINSKINSFSMILFFVIVVAVVVVLFLIVVTVCYNLPDRNATTQTTNNNCNKKIIAIPVYINNEQKM